VVTFNNTVDWNSLNINVKNYFTQQPPPDIFYVFVTPVYTTFIYSSGPNQTVSDTVLSQSSYNYQNKSNLVSVNIGTSCTTIGDNCFDSCTNLNSITIPSSVTTIGVNCFSSCSTLASITIPSSVTTIGKNCFSSCSSLTSFTFEDQSTINRDIPNGSDGILTGTSNVQIIFYYVKEWDSLSNYIKNYFTEPPNYPEINMTYFFIPSSGTFIYTFFNSTDANISTYLPLIATDSKLSYTFTSTILDSATKETRVTIDYTLTPNFYQNLPTKDGLSFSNVNSFYNGNSPNTITVESFDSIPLSRYVEGLFSQMENLIFTATDTPTISENTSLWYCFSGSTNFNSPIGNWDVSKVSGMLSMFSGIIFNQPIGNWDVSIVADMRYMFAGNTSFNQDLSNWNV
jgi:hypothetical protein